MAYQRRETTNGITVMNKELYDNLQDGIDEAKQSVRELSDNVDQKFEQGSGIKFDGERDMIMVRNPFTGEWIDWQSSGKIILPSHITVTTTTLDSEEVTLSIGGKVYNSQFENGVAVFTVYEDGEATIQCGEYSTTVTVQEKGGGTYSVTLEKRYYLIKNGEAIIPPSEVIQGEVFTSGEDFHIKANLNHSCQCYWEVSIEDLRNKTLVINPHYLNGIVLGFKRNTGIIGSIVALNCNPNKSVGVGSKLGHFEGVTVTDSYIKTEFSWSEYEDKVPEDYEEFSILIYFCTNVNGGSSSYKNIRVKDLFIQ